VRGRGKCKAKKAKHSVRKKSRDVGGFFDLPVLWRDVRVPILRSKRGTIVVGLIVAGILTLLYAKGEPDFEGFHMVLVVFVFIIYLFTAATVTTSTITTEREARTLDVLLTTPISVRSIIFQKFTGNLVRLSIIPFFFLCHFLYFGLTGVMRPWVAGHLFALSLGYGGLLIGSGILFGTLFKRSVTAAAVNTSFAIFLWLGLPMIASIIIREIMRSYDENLIGDVIAGGNPIYLTVTSISESFSRRTNGIEFGMSSIDISTMTYHVIVYASSIGAMMGGVMFARSEERRVGKECRSRWSPYH